jgi:carboxypeptidase C (cathepsin A)
VGEGFATTYSADEASKLVEDSTVMVSQVMEMIPIDMSQV